MASEASTSHRDLCVICTVSFYTISSNTTSIFSLHSQVEDQEEIAELKSFIQDHIDHTDSSVGTSMLENFDATVKDFVKVFPRDYARVLEERRMKEEENEQGVA